jgi:hypothetical protein
VVAGEQRVLLRKAKAQVVRRVTGRLDGLQCPTGSLDDVAFPHFPIGPVLEVAGAFHRIRFALTQWPRAAVRPAADDRRSRVCLESACSRGVVAVCVRDDYCADALALRSREQVREVGPVCRAGVNDRDLAPSDDVGAGSLEGERARIAGHDATHERAHLHDPAGLRREVEVEGEIVSHDTSGHDPATRVLRGEIAAV